MNQPYRILLCEDDQEFGLSVKQYLSAQNYQVDIVADGNNVLNAFQSQSYHLCVLEANTSLINGFELAKEIHHCNPNVPIIFISFQTSDEIVLKGFEIGADDFVFKPFSNSILAARIQAILHRSMPKSRQDVSIYTIGKYHFDSQKRILSIENKKKTLTTKESGLLELLCKNVNSILEREVALQTIWDEDNFFTAKSMGVYIAKLRRILSEDSTLSIMNIHNKGYQLIDPSKQKNVIVD